MASREFQEWWDRFSAAGDICPVRLGMTREELRELFGDPDETGGASLKHRAPSIWKYGDLEFHFGLRPEDPLRLIYLERDEVVKVSISAQNGPP